MRNRENMKVLMITSRLAEGAAQEAKVREISRLGVDLTVLSPPRWGKRSELSHLEPDGYKLLVRECKFSGAASIRLRRHLGYFPGISKVIGREKWDVVHIDDEPFNLATFQATRCCRRQGRRAVFTTWQNLMKQYPPPFNFFETYVYENVAGAIAGNKEGLDVLHRRRFGKPAAHIPQLGADHHIFKRQDGHALRRKLGLEGAFVVGFVGQIAYRKGLDTLITAMALLPKECALVLVGSGPDDARFKSLAQELGVSDRLRWKPWVDHREIAAYMSSFDVLTLPSRTCWNVKEQFGRVLVEAMACERCVVGSDVGAIPDVIGDAGMVFHEGHEHELAATLRSLAEDRSRCEMLGRRGRSRVLEHFTYEKIARDTVEFYKNVSSCVS